MTDWNTHYKRIRGALRLTYPEVVEICRYGGLEITRSRAEGWNRSPQDARRFVAMTEADFDAFTSGLPEWGRENIAPDTQ